MSFIPRGVIPAVVTPFDSRGKVNERVLRQLIDYLIKGGVHGLFVLGSQGEFYALEREEKKKIIEVTLDQVNKRVPVYAGTGAITTREAVFLTKMAEDMGVDAVSVITPFYVQPSQDELYEHFATIAKSTKLPVLLYNNPGRTGGVNISVDLAVCLSEIDNIIGIKDSSGDMSLTIEFIRRTDENFSVLVGRDSLIYAVLLHGGKGAIAATANVVPGLVVEIYEAYMKGELERARRAQERLIPLRLAFGLGSFPGVIKEALELIGIKVGSARAPIKPLSAGKKDELRKVLRQMEVLN